MQPITKNALRYWFKVDHGWDGRGDLPPRKMVADAGYEYLLNIPNVGARGRADIGAWLAEEGLTLVGAPDAAVALQRRLSAAEALLRKHGYKVRKPPNV